MEDQKSWGRDCELNATGMKEKCIYYGCRNEVKYSGKRISTIMDNIALTC